MQSNQSRHAPAQAPAVAPGWRLERLTPPSRLYGANGMRAAPDGRIFVAEFVGIRISLLDPDSGRLETVCAQGGEIVGPDDLALDAKGNIFVTEFMDARVSVLDARGHARVLRGGSWIDYPGSCRAACRGRDSPAYRRNFCGFRVCFRLD